MILDDNLLPSWSRKGNSKKITSDRIEAKGILSELAKGILK